MRKFSARWWINEPLERYRQETKAEDESHGFSQPEYDPVTRAWWSFTLMRPI
jgi:hypothetical protein